MKPETFICKECGKEVMPAARHNGKELARRQLCGDCNYWTYGISQLDPDLMIVDGETYKIEPDIPPGIRGLRGYDGREFRFQRLDNPAVRVSHNVWYYGRVPDHFRDRLPDNARILKIGEV